MLSKDFYLVDFNKIFPSSKEENKADHQYDVITSFYVSEEKEICFNIIDIINRNINK